MNTRIPPWMWIIGGIALFVLLGTGGVMVADYMSASWMQSANAQKWAPVLASAEAQFNIPAGLLNRIAFQESSFIQNRIDGTHASPAGALGIMGLEPAYFSSADRPVPFTDADTTAQIYESAAELARLFNYYGNWTYAVAAYNDGQGNINKVLNGSKTLPVETANYLAKVSADLPGIVNPTLQA